MEFRSVWKTPLTRAVVLAFGCIAATSADLVAAPFDLVAVLGKSFWSNAAILARSQKMEFPAGTVVIGDARHCGPGANGGQEFVVGILAGAATDSALFSKDDCNSSPEQLLSDKSFAGILRVVVLAGQDGIELRATSFRGRPGISSPALEQQLGKYSRTIGTETLSINDSGQTIEVPLIPRLVGSNLALFGSHAGYDHDLSDIDIPALGPEFDTNISLAVSHKAISKVAVDYLSNHQFRIGGSAVARSPKYVGAKDAVQVTALVKAPSLTNEITSIATWKGPTLLLSSLSASGSNIMDDVLAKAAAQLIFKSYQNTRIIPFEADRLIKARALGRDLMLRISTATSSSSERALMILGSIFAAPSN